MPAIDEAMVRFCLFLLALLHGTARGGLHTYEMQLLAFELQEGRLEPINWT